jgi:hypothetical protein
MVANDGLANAVHCSLGKYGEPDLPGLGEAAIGRMAWAVPGLWWRCGLVAPFAMGAAVGGLVQGIEISEEP